MKLTGESWTKLASSLSRPESKVLVLVMSSPIVARSKNGELPRWAAPHIARSGERCVIGKRYLAGCSAFEAFATAATEASVAFVTCSVAACTCCASWPCASAAAPTRLSEYSFAKVA